MTISEQITQAMCEAPQLVADSEMSLFEDRDWRYKKLESLSKHKSKWKSVAKVNGKDGAEQQLWSVSLDVGTEYFVVSKDNDKDISYYAKIKPVNNTGITPVKKQALVWQKSTFRGALDIFLTIYLPKYKYMATDQYQTTGGRRFWISLIDDVLRANGSVYFVTVGSNQKPIKINSNAELENRHNEIWGSSSKFKHRLLVVSQSMIDKFEQVSP